MVRDLLFFGKLVWLKVAGNKLPLTVIFNVTNRCNSRCKHCYAAYFSRSTRSEMSTDQIKILIRDLKNNGCLRINFSGGEPLLRKDIGELVNYAKSQSIRAELTSNGSLVPERLNELKNLDCLLVSLDGKPEHHDILRGKGSAVKALRAIKIALGTGIQVHVNMVIHKHNLNDIDYILDLARKFGFKVQISLAITNIFRQDKVRQVKPKNEEFRKVIRQIIKRKKEGAPILFSVAAYESVLNCWPDFRIEGITKGPAPKEMPLCPAGRIFCLIDADGMLWACPHLIGKTKAKNALRAGVAEAWRTANDHSCRGCYQVYHHEFSLLMNLKPEVLWNYFKVGMGYN